MGFIAAFILALSLVTVHGQSCGIPSVPSGRIIGGGNARHGSWPWQILLMENGRAGCGGTIVAPHTIVTAAHCVVDARSGRVKSAFLFTVRVGDNNRQRNDYSEVDHRVSHVIVNPYFSFGTFMNDVAILKLSTPITYNQYVQPACMPSFAPSHGTECYITGWGRDNRYVQQMSNQLKEAKMPVVDAYICKNAMRLVAPFAIGSNTICAGRGDSRQSGCQGDSGGPFVCRNRFGQFELHGAVSWGSKNCSDRRNQYTVFANIFNLSGWIRQYGIN